MVRFDMHTPHIVIRRMSEKVQKWILLYRPSKQQLETFLNHKKKSIPQNTRRTPSDEISLSTIYFYLQMTVHSYTENCQMNLSNKNRLQP
jgi:hypothetical protein